jgi:polyisoprenoid-binding protein YceI
MEFSNTMNRTPIQNKPLKIMAILIVGVIVMAVAAALYVWFSGGSAQPSGAISAPNLEVNGTAQRFHIVADNSEVRFIIDETLLGQPKTVIGATKEVAGDLAIDFTTPTNSKIGVIKINAKTLQTDSEIRNRALRGQILQATKPEFEFVTFVPKAIKGLPKRVKIGESLTVQIVGDLTVRDTTRSVTFEATVKPVSENRIEGTARATIQRGDFKLTIPNAPGVANVSEQVQLEIDFVALAASSSHS